MRQLEMSPARTVGAALILVIFLGLGCARRNQEFVASRPPQRPEFMKADCSWSAGQVAVSLTYDDNAPTQLTTVVPALSAHNLRATFFINDVSQDPEPWRQVASLGHELGSHTMHHPCPPADWVPEGFTSYDYDLSRMAAELDVSVRLLRDLGQQGPLTFAYPCGITWVGKNEQSYVSLVEARFMAARGVESQAAGKSPDLMNVPAFLLKGSGHELISKIEEARMEDAGPANAREARAYQARVDQGNLPGKWVVFGFHGVGGDWEIIAPSEHEALLAYLDDHRSDIYIAPFGEVARCWKRR